MVLLTSWLDYTSLDSKYDLIEFFAGVARIARLGETAGYRTFACDLEYSKPGEKRSPMDINSASGFANLV